SHGLQSKILRALEEREIERVGGDSSIPVDVRVIAATNRNLTVEMKAGRFREDLYYRLAVVVICMPPLRERGDDVQVLADHFLRLFACEMKRPALRVGDETRAAINGYNWPGNVRELRNVMHRAVLLTRDDVIRPEQLPHEILDDQIAPLPNSPCDMQTLAEVEKRHIQQVIAEAAGSLSEAARILGIHRNTLRRKLTEYGLR
ncbi:MAG: sigma-54-dependent Fis family transcriptional regulator, partial [Gemmatimonadota bacterium]